MANGVPIPLLGHYATIPCPAASPHIRRDAAGNLDECWCCGGYGLIQVEQSELQGRLRRITLDPERAQHPDAQSLVEQAN